MSPSVYLLRALSNLLQTFSYLLLSTTCLPNHLLVKWLPFLIINSDFGEGITDKIWEGAVTNIKDFYQIEINNGETMFAYNICNEGVYNEHSVK